MNRIFYKSIRDYVYVISIQLKSFRYFKFFIFLVSAVVPISILFLFTTLFSNMGRQFIVHILAGDIVLALLGISMLILPPVLSSLRASGGLDYYMTLPISKFSFVYGIATAYFLLSLPGLVIMGIGGSLVLNFPIIIRPISILIAFLTTLSFVSFGAAIGFSSKKQEQSSMIGYLVYIFLLFFSPVLIPLEKLPFVLRFISMLLPTTYAIHGIESSFGPTLIYRDVLFDILILSCYSVFSFYIILKKLTWRTSN